MSHNKKCFSVNWYFKIQKKVYLDKILFLQDNGSSEYKDLTYVDPNELPDMRLERES